MRWKLLFVLLMVGVSVCAQESQVGADFRGEGKRLSENCGNGLKGIFGCAEMLFTDHPLHIAVGSIAPQNGFGAGTAFVAHYTPNESWRLSWDVDAIGSYNASWRAGAYMKIIHTPKVPITVVTTPSGPPLSQSCSSAIYRIQPLCPRYRSEPALLFWRGAEHNARWAIYFH